MPTKRKVAKRSVKPALRLEWRSPKELADNPANWRRHPESQVNALADVIAEVGWAGACLYNERTKRLIDGHARRTVALSRGDKAIPVLVGNWTPDQGRTILATLDPVSGLAEADPEALAALLAEIETESAAVQAMLDGLKADAGIPLVEPGGGGDEFDPTPEATGPTRTKPGDLWVIGGKHRLLVGDCTDAGNLARLMGGEKAGLCFTSPPYAQQRDYGEAAKEKVQDWHALMCGAFACLPMTDAGQVLVNLGLVHRDGEWVPYWEEWIEWMRSQGWRRFGWYVWDQGPGLPGDWAGRLAPAFEFVFHFNREATKPEKTQDCVYAGHVYEGKGGLRGMDGEVQAWSHRNQPVQDKKIPDSVCRTSREKASYIHGHPAMFSLGFPTYFLEAWPADVYDPFLGSGTTLIAAHRLGRVCYGCEIEPRYADVILKRAEAEGLDVKKAE